MMLQRVGWTTMLALLILAVPAMAQRGGGRGMRGMMGTPSAEELTKELNLDAGQQETLGELLMVLEADTKDARDAMMENMQMVREGSVTMDAVREDNRQAMATLRSANEAFTKALQEILADEQNEAYTAYRAKMAERRGARRRPPPR